MHRLFRKALDDATGISQFVIVVIVDVRGFSAFSKTCESPDVAMFIKRVYMKVIDEYFPFASFYKSTGDGLLLTIPFDEKNLEEMAKKVIASCITCHSEFGTICSGDLMINVEVPQKIGIGVTRGTACCLTSGDIIIDYSGRLLNLTARLTDLARPSGIIIDGAFNINLLDDEQRGIFEEANVYLKGIYEKEPTRIYFTPEFTAIPEYNKQPIAGEKWQEQLDVKPFGELLKLGVFRYALEKKPASADSVRVKVFHNKMINGEVSQKYRTIHTISEFKYVLEGGRPTILVDCPKLCERLKKEQVKEDMDITISITYIEK